MQHFNDEKNALAAVLEKLKKAHEKIDNTIEGSMNIHDSVLQEEIVRIYGMRWDIEVFFKATKSLLRLQKEFLGGIFFELCDEVSELDWAVALQQLIELLEDTLKKTNKKIQKLIKSQLQQWIDGLPRYIKAYLPISVCEV